jgi:hypothetical protein
MAVRFRVGRVGVGVFAAAISGVLCLGAGAQPQAPPHTAALNLDPQVRRGYDRFYEMDFDGAQRIFEQVAQAHPNDPMAFDYLLLTHVFRALYQQDLLDTTYYAHDSFLSTKRQVEIPGNERKAIEDLTIKVSSLSDAALKANPNDKDALFARGYAKGLHASFITLADHSFAAAARQGYSARNDSEAVLKLDPQYADAKMAVGIQQFAVASLPGFVRILVGVMGVGGSKPKGIALLKDAGAHGVVTSVESRTALSLFLRHDGRYPEALDVERGLAAQYPHDYLFRLEVANLLKDEGHGLDAIAEYKKVLEDAAKPGYFVDARLQLAYFGLADTQRGYNDLKGAQENYLKVVHEPNCSDWLRKRAWLYEGQVSDMLHDRAAAMRAYQQVLAAGGDQSQADAARKYMRSPYVGK